MSYINFNVVLAAWNEGYEIDYKYSGSQYRICHEGDYQIKYKKATELSGEFIQHKTRNNIFDDYPYLEAEINAALKNGSVNIPGYSFTGSIDSYTPENRNKTDVTAESNSPDLARYDLLYNSHLISKEEYEKLKSEIIQRTGTYTGTGPKPLYSPEKRQKKRLPTGLKVSIGIFSAIIIIVLIAVFSSIKVKFGSMDPDTVNSSAGKDVISYDLVNREYTKNYLSDVIVASSKKNCGYIVKYKIRMKPIEDQYERVPATQSGIPYPNANGTPTTVYQENVDISIYDVHTGKTIASKTFSAQLSYTLDSSYVHVNKNEIARWIKDNIPKRYS